jgi:hypothetical protein
MSKRKRERLSGQDRKAQEDYRDSTIARSEALLRAQVAEAFGATNPIKPDPGEDPRLNRPRVTDDMPILAHRAAQLVERPGGAQLQSMTAHGGQLLVDMDAMCQSNQMLTWSMHYTFSYPGAPTAMPKPNHKAPDWDCHCGFYAVPLADALPYNTWHVDLLVELSGTVIEHESEPDAPTCYRAQHQRLIEARIPACGLCGLPVHGVRLGEAPLGRCSRHLADGAWLTRDDLARVLPVPVTYLGEDDAHRT